MYFTCRFMLYYLLSYNNNLMSNLQFFYAIASTKSSNIIVLCMAEIMVSAHVLCSLVEI